MKTNPTYDNQGLVAGLALIPMNPKVPMAHPTRQFVEFHIRIPKAIPSLFMTGIAMQFPQAQKAPPNMAIG